MDDIKFPPKSPTKPINLGPKLDQIRDSATMAPQQPTQETQLSSSEQLPKPEENIPEDIDIKIEDKPKSKYKVFISPRHLSRKSIIILIGVLIVICGSGFAGYWFFFKPDKPITQNNNTVVKSTPTPTPVPVIKSPLTGIELSDSNLAQRPVTGIMIENSPDARPQSGLVEAGIVFEAVAEGGITRFLALYQDTRPNYIGPVRSARPYFIDFTLPFNASYGHVGGSPDALNDIKALGVRDLDQFFNPQAYWRITERYAPHNMYTSFDKLDALNTKKGYSSSSFTPFERKIDVPQTPTATTIDFSISSPLYSPRFIYDTATNSYKRSQAGSPHIDQKSKTQISSKVVIALVMKKGYMADGSHTTYQDTGSGKMFVFQDGIFSEGTWVKADRKSQLIFTDKNGLPLKLNAGQTWISIVGSDSDVIYKL